MNIKSKNNTQSKVNDDRLVYDIDNRRYINLTDRCTLCCQFCPKQQHNHQLHSYDLTIHDRSSAQQYIDLLGDVTQFDEIVFCGYGEPTLRLKDLIVISQYVKANGGRVRVNTDGLANAVHKRNVLPELAECVDALSISMNAQNQEVYDRHCHPALANSYQSMLDFIALAPSYIDDVTATAIDGLAGVDIVACRELALQRGVKFKRRVLGILG